MKGFLVFGFLLLISQVAFAKDDCQFLSDHYLNVSIIKPESIGGEFHISISQLSPTDAEKILSVIPSQLAGAKIKELSDSKTELELTFTDYLNDKSALASDSFCSFLNSTFSKK